MTAETTLIMLDSGSDEHCCTTGFAPMCDARPYRHVLEDVQERNIETFGVKRVGFLLETWSGEPAPLVSDLVVASVGKTSCR